jgi:hypothetical protein
MREYKYTDGRGIIIIIIIIIIIARWKPLLPSVVFPQNMII